MSNAGMDAAAEREVPAFDGDAPGGSMAGGMGKRSGRGFVLGIGTATLLLAGKTTQAGQAASQGVTVRTNTTMVSPATASHPDNLAHALTDPQALWAFLTNPQTPYQARMAAVTKGRNLFPLSSIALLVDTLDMLQEEERLHRWGLKPGPMESLPAIPYHSAVLSEAQRRRMILGQVWIVPKTPTMVDPSSKLQAGRDWQQQMPWPWQVKQALSRLFEAIQPQTGVSNSPEMVMYIQRWYDEALKLPCHTDKEALRFVTITEVPVHYKTLPILARWRRIALNPQTPKAARQIARSLGDAIELWDDPRAQDIGQSLFTEILTQTRDREVRTQAAWSTIHLKAQLHFSQTPGEDSTRQLPPPWQVIVALGDLALDKKQGDVWDRLYCFAQPACALLPRPPLKVDINSLKPDSPQALAALQAFTTWFVHHRAEFVTAGQQQIHAWQAIQALHNDS